MEALRENNIEMEKIISTLKVPKTDVVTIEKPLTHVFEDLISDIIIVLRTIDLNKVDLEILLL